MTDFRALCAELADSVELLLEMRAVDAKPMAITEDRFFRARAALAQSEPQGPGRPAIEPVPVAERLPGPEDCDAEGCCWFYSGRYGRWERLLHKLSLGYTHWLPHHALPVPQQGE